MQPFRFIQCGDLHLGTPFSYVKMDNPQVNQVVATSTYRSFERIVELAIVEGVDALFITGDVYNSADHNLAAQVQFVRLLRPLEEAQIPVYIVQGNHDPAESWQAHIAMPSNVHIFSDTEVERMPLMVGNIEIGGIYGISCGHGNERVSQVENFQKWDRDEFSIAMMHGTVGGVSAEHMTVNPCTQGALLDRGMDYWALGHIHKRSVVHQQPYVVYAGNSQGLHKKETGPKGCYLVQVASNGHCELTFKETNAVRFEHVDIPIDSLHTEAEMVEMIRHHKEMIRTKVAVPVLLDITLTGMGPMYRLCADEQVRQSWLVASQEDEAHRHQFVMPYEIRNASEPEMDLAIRLQGADVVGDYLRAFMTIGEGRQIIEERPEMKRLGSYQSLLTDELIERALQRAKIEGAMRLAGESDED